MITRRGVAICLGAFFLGAAAVACGSSDSGGEVVPSASEGGGVDGTPVDATTSDGGAGEGSVGFDAAACESTDACPPLLPAEPCMSDDDCENDTYCNCQVADGGDGGACAQQGLCVAWTKPPRGQFNDKCHTPGFAPAEFKAPQLHCNWKADAGNDWVVMTPVVADLDNDGTPEIVFGPQGQGTGMRLAAIRPSDCSVIFDKPVNLQVYSQIAVADLDGDKVPEIVGVGNDKNVRVFDNQGNLLATSPTPYTFSQSVFDCSGPAIADVDGVAPAEIVVAGQVLRYTKGQASLTVLFTQPAIPGTWGTLTAVADMDGDHSPEIITGRSVLDGVTGADKTPSNLKAYTGPGGYPAIADFNGDSKPDIVLVQSMAGSQKVSIFDYTANAVIFGPYAVAGGG